MRLKDCESCLVYGSDRKPLSRARVTEVKENVLQLYFRSPKLKAVRLKTIVDFYDAQQGLIRTLCDMTLKKNPKVYEAGEPWMADCTILEVKDSLQRQQDIRARVRIDISFESERHGTFYGTIENISAGGFFVRTKMPLDRNELISFQYSFRTAVRLFKARVIRMQRMGDEYGFGCRFIDLSENAEAVIREHVYKVLKEKERQRRQ